MRAPCPAIAWAFALLSFGAPCGAGTLRLAVSDGPVSLPIYVAQSKGFFDNEHLAVEATPCASGLA